MATTKLWTAKEIAALPEDEAVFELWHGEKRRVSPTGGRHGAVSMNVAWHLRTYVEQSGIGTVLINDTGFLLAREPDLLLCPDIAIVPAGHLPLPVGFLETVPLLVVEVISPSERTTDIEAKIALYRDAGVPLIWTVMPATNTVYVDGAGRARATIVAPGDLDGGDVLPEMPPLPLAEIFR